MSGSYESYKGRSKYAEIVGAYYAARLAVAEKLHQIQKQASVLILREVHENYSIPVGVWQVREHLRQILKKSPQILNTTLDIPKFISNNFTIPSINWIKNSKILTNIFTQKKLSNYFIPA